MQRGSGRTVGCGRCHGHQNIVHADRGEQVAPDIAIQIQTQAVLGVHAGANGGGEAPQQVAPLHHVAVLKTQQARDLAAIEGVFIHGNAGTVALDHQFVLLWVTKIVLGRGQRQGGRRTAQHQRLAATNVDADGAVIGGYRGGLHVLVEVVDELVALVQQVVRRLATALGQGNLAVHVGNLLGQRVDRADFLVQRLGNANLQVIQALRGRAHAPGGFIDPGQGHGACGQVGRGAGHIREGVEHVVDGRAHAGAAALKNIAELFEVVRTGGVGCLGRGRQGRLARQKLVVVALNGLDVHPLADITGTGVLACHRGHDDALARVAHGVDVGNVVANGLQCNLVGLQRLGADIEDAHGLCP